MSNFNNLCIYIVYMYYILIYNINIVYYYTLLYMYTIIHSIHGCLARVNADPFRPAKVFEF